MIRIYLVYAAGHLVAATPVKEIAQALFDCVSERFEFVRLADMMLSGHQPAVDYIKEQSSIDFTYRLDATRPLIGHQIYSTNIYSNYEDVFNQAKEILKTRVGSA